MREPSPTRLFVRLSRERWRAVDLADVYFVEAQGDDSSVRLRGKSPLPDLRRIGELEEALTPHGFVRIHRSFLVNPARIRLVRRRASGEGWEVVLEPPVNRVLPVADDRLAALRERFA